jgi:hypothetical protein
MNIFKKPLPMPPVGVTTYMVVMDNAGNTYRWPLTALTLTSAGDE